MNKEKNLKKISSFDDLEIGKFKKENLSKVFSERSVKDDFDITYKQESKKKILEKPLEKKSKIAQIFKKISIQWNKFKKSKVGKILLSNSLNYAISLTGAVIAFSGLFTPLSPLIIATASIAAIGIGIQAVNETIKIRNLRRLHKENNLLVQNRNAKAGQDYVLNLEPKLNDILKDELFTPYIKEKNLNSDKYKINNEKLKSIGLVLANNVSSITSTISTGLSGNAIDILKAIGYGVLTSASLITSRLDEKEKIELETMFKLNINEEWKKKDTPYYKNLTQLENYTIEQTLTTLALKKLITDEHYWSMKDEEKIQKFKEIKSNFNMEIQEKGTKIFFKENTIILDTKKESYIGSFKRVLDPSYNNPKKAREYSPLTKAMDKKSSKAITR